MHSYKSVVMQLIHKVELQNVIKLYLVDFFVIFYYICFYIQVDDRNAIANSTY
jgi:hypothetical protein